MSETELYKIKAKFKKIKMEVYYMSVDAVMKIHERAEKEIKKCCANCESNFGNVCAGSGKRTDNGESTYGMPMNEAETMFPDGCESYGYSLHAFEDFCEKNNL